MQIKANYYSIYPTRFIAGTQGSHGVETLDITFSEEWEGMTKKVVFYPSEGDPICVIYEDRPIKIPPEATNTRGKTKYAIFGYSDDKRLISVCGEFDVLTTLADTDNYVNAPTPDEIEQVYAYMRESIDVAQSVRDDADSGIFKGEKGDTGEKGEKGDKGEQGEGVTYGLGINSVVFGEGNTAGCKGYYFYDINIENKTMHLSPLQNAFVDSDAFTVEWEVGDVISIINNNNYYNCSTITAINGSVITVDILPFESVVKKENPQHIDYAVFCSAKPQVGVISFGDNAFAVGENNMATFNDSFAAGYNNKATGQYGFAQGLHNEAYFAAQALGRQNKAYGERSFAQGLACQALGNDTHASGRNCVADGQYSMARGYETRAEKEASNALGYKTKASGTHSMAWNESATASGTNATAFGINTEASGSLGTAFGQSTKATGSRGTAMGYATEASDENAVAMGHSTKAAGKHQLVTGKFNKAISGNTTGFIVGGGSSESARKNAIEVDWNGNTRIGGSITLDMNGTPVTLTATQLKNILNGANIDLSDYVTQAEKDQLVTDITKQVGAVASQIPTDYVTHVEAEQMMASLGLSEDEQIAKVSKVWSEPNLTELLFETIIWIEALKAMRITFTIGGTEYEAIRGMTWREWANSFWLDGDVHSCDGDDYYVYGPGVAQAVFSDIKAHEGHGIVVGSDVINAGEAYTYVEN